MNEILMKKRALRLKLVLIASHETFQQTLQSFTDQLQVANYVHNNMGSTKIQKTLFHTNNTNQRGDHVYSTNHIRKVMFIAPSFAPLIGRLQSLIGQQGYFQP